MRNAAFAAIALAVAAAAPCARAEDAPVAAPKGATLRVLLLSGRNNHNWRLTTPHLQSVCEATGRFRVEVLDQPETMTAEMLKPYEAILSNWNAFGAKDYRWPEAARAALIDFVRADGKGFASVHAGSSSFNDWKEYQEMTITGWRGSAIGHGRYHAFPVTIAAADHPVMRGLKGFTIADELWHRAAVAEGAQTLATAHSAKESGGSGADEPVALARTYGKGRSFNLLLGHDLKATQNPGFCALLTRGLEWSATGSVTLPAPKETDDAKSR
jgi:type 1 glutamine amidotransferase